MILYLYVIALSVICCSWAALFPCRCSGETALLKAARYQRRQICSLLVKVGASPIKTDNYVRVLLGHARTHAIQPSARTHNVLFYHSYRYYLFLTCVYLFIKNCKLQNIFLCRATRHDNRPSMLRTRNLQRICKVSQRYYGVCIIKLDLHMLVCWLAWCFEYDLLGWFVDLYFFSIRPGGGGVNNLGAQ